MELRTLREATGLTGDEAAKQLGWSTSKLSRIEVGRNPPKLTDLEQFLDFCSVTDQRRRAELAELRREAKRKGWWQAYSDIPYSTYIGMEAEAASMLTYQQVVPGLFQTESYARAVIKATWPAIEAEALEERVEVRMTRQQVLTRERALQLRAILDETCIRRMVGGPEVMKRQFTRLLDLAALPNVLLQVLPFSVGAHPGTMLGPFSILEFGSPDDPNIVYVESDSDPYPDREGDVERYTMAFDHIRSMALNVSQSSDLLKAALEAL
jgi:transcriptional regulator with XRE-family HTH domain